MNKLTLNVLRTASLATLCLIQSSTSRAADRAAQAMASQGSVSVSQVGTSLSIGSTKEQVYRAVGNADVVLPDGTRVFRKAFYIDHSAANGRLVVEFSEGKVSAMHLVSPFMAVAMISHTRPSSDVTVVASLR
jgi:hypothetical protein